VKKQTLSQDSEALSTDFLDFIIELNKHHVDFVLIGGYAMGVHGVVRATGDIDFLYRCTRPNVRRLCVAMEEFGAPPEVIDEIALMTPNIVTQFGVPPNRIDLLNTIDGVTFRQVWAGSTSTTIQEQKLHVIGLAELMANKTVTGRIRDADDVRRLQSVKPRNKK
jgi:hypothetical protein